MDAKCPRCGYSLAGLGESGACPGCGWAYTPERLRLEKRLRSRARLALLWFVCNVTLFGGAVLWTSRGGLSGVNYLRVTLPIILLFLFELALPVYVLILRNGRVDLLHGRHTSFWSRIGAVLAMGLWFLAVSQVMAPTSYRSVWTLAAMALPVAPIVWVGSWVGERLSLRVTHRE